MKSLNQLQANVKYLFCDIDDTITSEGRLEADAYQALWQLESLANIKVIPITGRPAGWCELIARLWPVDAVIGENGAFYFSYKNKKMHRNFYGEESSYQKKKEDILKLSKEVLQKFPGTAMASDQFCRLLDAAIDFCEDVPPLDIKIAKEVKAFFESHGAIAKVSSIHVNAWFGEHDKLKMCRKLMLEEFKLDIDQIQNQCLFIGDSPNDEPMFSFFKNSVGVANVLNYKEQIQDMPKYLCSHESGKGFVELTEHLLNLHQKKQN